MLHGAKVGVTTTIIADLYRKKLPTIFDETKKRDTAIAKRLEEHRSQILQWVNELPDSETLKGLLQLVGGPTTPEELEMSDELVKESLNHAFKLRERCTGLLILNQLKAEDIPYPF
ncbi:hypothetical protein [Aquibacillus albus]|uniref:Glycerol dehydrogenase-like iron-containing ADH family enzyme n=1 Tax=Aquibacillus albus TaxID=1168171 RepID=A0ABS2MXV6_9BACI|nr:hypothetical protein [Aquibacillus albus]MBM7570676.1 glycerol dehydrogenase-like iron-containing ADH family enzyme [Aquibacillus albus]